jgi:deoxyribodipyrimidine photo-lyase
MTTILWYRQDLRVDDAPALLRSADDEVIPLFVHAPDEEAPWAPGGASRWWLHHSLGWLGERLRSMGSRLVLRQGPTAETILDVASATGASRVVTSRRYEPHVDVTRVRAVLAERGVAFEEVEGATLFPLDALRTGSGRPYQVYTPFARALRAMDPPDRPKKAPELRAPSRWPGGEHLDSFGLLPSLPWAREFPSWWTPGGEGAAERLRRFLAGPIETYSTERDQPHVLGTSGLSPHLHFGEISPRRIWHTVGDAIRRRNDPSFTSHAEKFLAELLWREFAHNVLLHFPRTESQPLRSEYARFPWRNDPTALRAWQRGQTGYPIVDAGMRQLWRIGWMHNRVRMVVASFLVKHLLLPWQEGATWFWETLVDADLANNSLGWQWSAGSGADAAPYFRVFNPVLQGKKFDADGAYVRAWVPELAKVPIAWIHAPWEAPPAVLSAAGVRLGEHYPKPIVDHGIARQRAMDALAVVSLERESNE